MNKQEEHRDDEQLLRLADGELDAKQAAQAHAHLEACWHCRTRLEDLQAGIAGYMRYRERVMEQLLPPPPQPWGTLRSRLSQIDAAVAPRRTWPNLFARPQWLATAAAALLIGLLAYRLQHEPVVSAAELLRKASAAEASSSPRRRIRIKTRTHTLVRAAAARNQEGNADLRALFVAANFSWEDPLSARSFAAWRAQLTDAVDVVRVGSSQYEIHTSTRTNKLREAELTMRKVDLRPMREILQFEAGERLEISEEPDEEAAPAVSVASSRPASAAAREPSPSPVASAGDELRVIAALHQIGADLGEPIDVARANGSDILVTGTGLSPTRQEQIRRLFEDFPRVTLRFDEPQQPIAADKESRRSESRASAAPVSMLQLQLQSYLGGAQALQKFTDGILDASENATERAHGLRNLAERFPAGEERTMSPEELRLLAILRRDHERALKSLVRQMVQLLQPVVPVPEGSGSPGSSVWQDHARNLLDATMQVDSLLNQMLAGGDSGAAQKHTPHELASALSELQALLADR